MKKFSNIPRSQGQAVITAVLLFLFGSLVIIAGIVTPIVKEIRGVRTLVESKQSYFAAEGSLEDVSLRLKQGNAVVSPQTLTLGGVAATTTIVDVFNGKSLATVAETESEVTRAISAVLIVGTGASFSFGVQSDVGGMLLENSSRVYGNVLSNGPIQGSGNSIGVHVISAGPSGFVSGIHATSSMYAHTIQNSTIDKDAYYQSISGSTVLRTSYPGSADQSTSSLPISDALVETWESVAASGGTISSPCPYVISSDTTIGPKKIACDLVVSGNPTVTFAGPIWVVGNVTFQNNPTIVAASSLGKNSAQIIADNPSDNLNSAIMDLNNGSFFGSGDPQSYIVFLSQNRSAEAGGSNVAITLQNSANGKLLLYAGRGEILIRNNVSLREVTGYKLHLQNSALVTYETGVINLNFSSGPSGSFSIDSWEEI